MTPRGRNQAPVRSPRNNGRLVTLATENGFPERNSRDNALAQVFVHKGSGKSGSSFDPSGSPQKKVNSNGNGEMHQQEPFVEFGSIGHLPPEAPLLRGSWQTNSASAPIQDPGIGLASPGTEKLKPVLSTDKDRYEFKLLKIKAMIMRLIRDSDSLLFWTSVGLLYNRTF